LSRPGVGARRVLVATPWYPTVASPFAGAFCRDGVEALRAAGHSLTVVHASPDARATVGDRVRRARYPGTARAAVVIGAARAAAAIAAAAAARRPDLIHAHVTLPVGLAAACVGRLLRVPVVLTEHTGPFESQLGSPLRERLATWTLASVHAVVAVSRALLARMRPFLPPGAPAHLIANPVDVEAFGRVRRPAPGQARLLFVGRLAPEKRLPDLVEALRLLRQRRPAATLRLVGDGPERARLAGPDVRIDGALSRAATADAVAEADVVVLPSQHETFGVALVEALAAGRPVVATRCGGPEEIVTPEVGELVPVADPPALADAIDRVLARRFDAAALSAYAGQRWSFAAFARAQGALYDELLDRRC
jgi:glycosyltransferase involved in cell wall biosynthesis